MDYLIMLTMLIAAAIIYSAIIQLECHRVHNVSNNSIFHILEALLVIIMAFIPSMRVVDNMHPNGDMIGYINFFLYDKYSFEPLFSLIVKTIRSMTDNYHVYMFILYFMISLNCYLYSKYAVKHKTNILCYIMAAYVYFASYSGIRQWLAVSICMVSFILLRKNKNVLAWLLYLFCIGIHYVMAALLPGYILYFFAKNKIISVNTKCLLMIALAGNLFLWSGRDLLIQFLRGTQYVNYVTDEILNRVSWMGYIPSIVICILGVIYYKNLVINDSDNMMIVIFCTMNLALIYAAAALAMWKIDEIYFPYKLMLYGELLYVTPKIRHYKVKRGVMAAVSAVVIIYFVMRAEDLVRNGGILPFYIGVKW